MSTLKKIWVDATLKKSQVAPYKNLGRFYRVPFKSLLIVQIKCLFVFEAYGTFAQICEQSNHYFGMYGKKNTRADLRMRELLGNNGVPSHA